MASDLLVRWCWREEVDTGLLTQRLSEFRFDKLKRFSADPTLYFELVPDLDLVYGRARIVTDHEGFRIAEHPLPHAAGSDGEPFRIALVGPSTAFGWNVAYDETYGELVRRRLESSWRRAVDLRNFGVPAYNSIQEERLLETKVLPWRPGLILWDYDHRDAYPVIAPTDPVGMPPEYGDNRLHSAIVKLCRRRWRAIELAKLQLRGEPYTEYRNHLTSGRAYDEHLAALLRGASAANGAHVPVVLFIHDLLIERGAADGEHFERLHRPLLDRLGRSGLRVVDLYPRLQELMEARGWNDLQAMWISTAPRDPHPNAEGHAFIAGELVRAIESMADLPGR